MTLHIPIMMTKSFRLVVLSLLLSSAKTEAAECETGWVAYKDEHCFKLFTNLVSYDDAKGFCASQGSEIVKASLVMIKDEDMQEMLGNYTQDIFDYVWLGGRYDNTTEQFKWEDGSVLTYTNWQEGYPRNLTDSDSCIEMRPSNARLSTNANGQWANVVCQKRNLVMCQKTLPWNLQDAINEIIRIRKELVLTQGELQATKESLQTVSSNVVPVGSIYIEYQNQLSPVELWPNLSWEDVSSIYAGLFFRSTGDDAASWGTTQEGCAPRISQMQVLKTVSPENYNFTYPLNIPTASGWSGYGHAGLYDNSPAGPRGYEGLRFNIESCEVRPRNQAIRIWKRIA